MRVGGAMEDYNFKVVAELRDDLDEQEAGKAKHKINDLKRRLRLIQLDSGEYIKMPPNKGIDDFAAVYGFYHELENNKQWFSKLMYYNLFQGITRQAV